MTVLVFVGMSVRGRSLLGAKLWLADNARGLELLHRGRPPAPTST